MTGATKVGVVFVAALGVLAAGCDRGHGAGEYATLPVGAPMSIGATPVSSVGVTSGDTLQELYQVVTPFLLQDGRLVVPSSGANAIKVFGPDGRYLKTLGRAGEGPGEFAWLMAAWPRGDTIEAFDARLGRITQFLPDGTIHDVTLNRVRAAQAAVPGAIPGGWILYGVVAVDRDGRDEVEAHLFGRDGSHEGRIAQVHGMLRYRFEGGSGPTPLSPQAFFAIHGGTLYVAESPTPRIRELRPTGEAEREITWKPDAAPEAGEVLAVVIDSAVSRAAPDQRAVVRRKLEASPAPGLSVLWGLMVDEEGFIWIRPYDPLVDAAALGGLAGAGPGGRWRVLSPEGEDAGSVEIPHGLVPTQITSDRIVGIHRDELGVESVRVYALTRR
jgi:hypothetical protein